MNWGNVADWVSAGGTIGASIVALWIALRADRTRVRVTLAEIGWDKTDPAGLRLDLLVSNAGGRPVVIDSIGLRVAGSISTLVVNNTIETIEFARTSIYSISWATLEGALRNLTNGRRLWRIRVRLPRPVVIVCTLATGEVITVPLPPRTLARIRGQKVLPELWMGSHVDHR